MQDDCETEHILGTHGKYFQDNQTCVCPPGFSGKGTLVTLNDCHVNESIFNKLHKVCQTGTQYILALSL